MMIAALLAMAAPAEAARLVVDDDGRDCRKADFTSIQAAVDAAGEKDHVDVCDGRYAGAVTITTPGLRLKAAKHDTVVIVPGTGPEEQLVEIDADEVRFKGFDIRFPTGCQTGAVTSLVRISGGLDVRFEDNRLFGIREAQPCPSGFDYVEGLTVGEPGGTVPLSADIEGNEFRTGAVETATVAIRVLSGDVRIAGNLVKATAQQQSGTGISVEGPAQARVKGNDVNGWDIGIFLFASGTPTRFVVFGNWVHDNLGTGILDGGIGDRIEANAVFRNQLGIVFVGQDADIRYNVVRDSDAIGLFADEFATGALFLGNVSLGSGQLDCLDLSQGSDPVTGTANRWKDDIGVTDSPPTLCRPPY